MIRQCPKCSAPMHSYQRKNETWLRCKGCKMTLPAVALPEPEAGLDALKGAPVAPRDGLAGLRVV